MMKLRAAFAGPAITLMREPPNNAQAVFSFETDGKLPLVDIDAFRGGERCRVIQRADQISGVPGFNTDYISSVSLGPRFADLTIGAHRCMWMQSDCDTSNGPTPDGHLEFMRAFSVSGLNVPLNAMTVMQVVQLHNAAYCNQISGPFRGTLFASDAVIPPNLIQHTRIYSEFLHYSDLMQSTGGGFTVETGDGFQMRSINAWLESSPIVMTYITGPSGTFIGRNEDFRSVTGHPSLSTPAAEFFIGCNEGSLVASPSINEGMGMAELLTIVWNQALTMQQAAVVRAAIYGLVGINHLHSHSNKPLILLFTDSVWAGYKADDLRGWDKRAMLQLPSDVRWANFAIPGGATISNPSSPFLYNGARDWFPGWMAQAVRQHRGRVHCVWGTPINDYYDGSITPQFVYDNATVPLINRIRAVDPTATITLCTGTRSSIPIHDQHLTDGSVIIRNGAAANHYNVVEVRNDPIMGVVNSGAEWEADNSLPYKDGLHLSNAGCDRMAQLILPTLQTWLQSLGPY